MSDHENRNERDNRRSDRERDDERDYQDRDPKKMRRSSSHESRPLDREALRAQINRPKGSDSVNYNTEASKIPERNESSTSSYGYDRRNISHGEEDGDVDNTIPNKIFIGGISWSSTEEGLKSYFEQFGEVTVIDLMRNRMDNQPRGFGFITFKEPAGVSNAVKKRMHEIDGKQVEVKRAIKKNDEVPRGPKSNEGSTLPCKLFIGGITPDTRESDLEEHFSKFGPLVSAVVMMDSQTNRGRGFGFVTYENKEDSDKVLAEPEHLVNGKLVDVKSYKARGTEKKPAGGGGYGHSHGGGMMYGMGQMGMGRGYGNMGMYGGQGYGNQMYGGGYGGYGGQMYGGYAAYNNGGYNQGYGGYGGEEYQGYDQSQGGYSAEQGGNGYAAYGNQGYGSQETDTGAQQGYGGYSTSGGGGYSQSGAGGGSGGGYGNGSTGHGNGGRQQSSRDSRYKPY